MSIFVQFKDGIAFAYVESSQPVDNSVLLDSDMNWEDVKGKMLVDGEWVDSPRIKFISSMNGSIVTGVKYTHFPWEVHGDVIPDEVDVFWSKNEDGSYSAPAPVEKNTVEISNSDYEEFIAWKSQIGTEVISDVEGA